MENAVAPSAPASTVTNPPSGGAVLLTSSDFVYMRESIFVRNNATGVGGAISQSLCGMTVAAQAVTISNSTFISNLASLSGGAIMSQNSKTTVVTGSTFMYNKASRSVGSTSKLDSNGGAVCFDGSSGLTGTISNSTFQSNRARTDGGAVAISGGFTDAIIANNTFYGNNAGLAGGAVAVLSKATRVTLKHNHFHYNTAINNGGALDVEDSSYVYLQNCDFIGNDATGIDNGQGGALSISWVLVMPVVRCSFQNNSAAYQGGAVWIQQKNPKFLSNVTFDQCQFANNVAAYAAARVQDVKGTCLLVCVCVCDPCLCA